MNTDLIIQFKHHCKFCSTHLENDKPSLWNCNIFFFFSFVVDMITFCSAFILNKILERLHLEWSWYTLHEVRVDLLKSGYFVTYSNFKIKVHFRTHVRFVFNFLWKSNKAWGRNRSTRVAICRGAMCYDWRTISKNPSGHTPEPCALHL